jgi:Flp pilus assembly protein TadG
MFDTQLMTKLQRVQFRRRNRIRHGAMLVMMVLMIPVVLIVAAYAINVVYMEMTRTELQITVDVATRAAGRTLAVTGDQELAKQAAERLMLANPLANGKLTLDASDVVFGVSTRLSEDERYTFAAGPKPNAVQIQANGKMKVPMLFPTMGVPVQFRPIKECICTQAEMDIALVIDRSGSMAFAADEVSGIGKPASAPLWWFYGGPVPPRSRWLDAMDATQQFLELMSESYQSELVSLSTFSTLASKDVELTQDYSRISSALAFHGSFFLGGTTNIGGGMVSGISMLSDRESARSWATRVMIVLTDGMHNLGTDPIYAAKTAAAENILIYTITFSDEADIETMKAVASIGSGKHYHALTQAELVNAFKDIARTLPSLITH